MGNRDMTSAKAKEALLKDKDKFCGECCWFYAEDTYGYGMCPFMFAEMHKCGQKCDVPEKYVGKKEMRHHMAVLLQLYRCETEEGKNGWDSEKKCWGPVVYRKLPTMKQALNAMLFAYKYMKIFSEL